MIGVKQVIKKAGMGVLLVALGTIPMKEGLVKRFLKEREQMQIVLLRGIFFVMGIKNIKI